MSQQHSGVLSCERIARADAERVSVNLLCNLARALEWIESMKVAEIRGLATDRQPNSGPAYD